MGQPIGHGCQFEQLPPLFLVPLLFSESVSLKEKQSQEVLLVLYSHGGVLHFPAQSTQFPCAKTSLCSQIENSTGASCFSLSLIINTQNSFAVAQEKASNKLNTSLNIHFKEIVNKQYTLKYSHLHTFTSEQRHELLQPKQNRCVKMVEQRKYLPGFVVNVDRTKVVMFTHTESATQGV